MFTPQKKTKEKTRERERGRENEKKRERERESEGHKIITKNTFIEIPKQDETPRLRRSSSIPADMWLAQEETEEEMGSYRAKRGSYRAQIIFEKNIGKTGPKFCFAPYGNWERIDWTEMTGNTLRNFVDPRVWAIRSDEMAKSWEFMIFDIFIIFKS